MSTTSISGWLFRSITVSPGSLVRMTLGIRLSASASTAPESSTSCKLEEGVHPDLATAHYGADLTQSDDSLSAHCSVQPSSCALLVRRQRPMGRVQTVS